MILGVDLSAVTSTLNTKAWHAMAKFGDDDSAYMQPIHGSGTQGEVG